MTKKITTPTAAELSRVALDEARAKLATWQELHEEAETAAAELLSRLTSGDGPRPVWTWRSPMGR